MFLECEEIFSSVGCEDPNVEIVYDDIIVMDDKIVDDAKDGSNLYSNFAVGGIAFDGVFLRKRSELETDLNLLAHFSFSISKL